VVVVARIDRLAHSTFDLFAIVKSIVHRKARFRSRQAMGGCVDVDRPLDDCCARRPVL
jgi:hypothetical protein